MKKERNNSLNDLNAEIGETRELGDEETEQVAGGKVPFQCQYCGAGFLRAEDLLRHECPKKP